MSHVKTKYEAEASNKARVSTIVVALLLLICLFLVSFSIREQEKIDEEEGILVNFGTSNVGSGEIQPQDIAEKVSPPPPPKVAQPIASTPVIPKVKVKTQKEILTQKTETAKIQEKKTPKKPVKKVEKKPVKETPKKRTETKTEVKKPTKTTDVKNTNQNSENSDSNSTSEQTPTINKRALYPGKKKVNSSSEGNDNGKNGDKGQIDGSPEKDSYTGKNSGLGKNGVGYALAGRKMVEAPSLKDKSNIQGKVTIKITVDQNGQVISASLGRPTTISDNTLINKAIAAAKQAKFDKNREAAEEQFGTMTFIFKVM